MKQVTVDFSTVTGKIKPMHATNHGPVSWNFDAFVEAGIPYARNHDASFFDGYGGEHSVDTYAVFPNFDADPYDPANYDFVCTDAYVKICEDAGIRTFYRLGTKIEHTVKKYNTLPPKDFHKWAVICEHIIRHYTEGWADGFYYDMKYWEIWNEADMNDDAPVKPTWGSTRAEFYRLYHITATHLKECFPHLMIGGPGNSGRFGIAEEFLAQLKAPLDFFSWHRYTSSPEMVTEKVRLVRELLDKYGYTETESILDEWNYIRSFAGEDFKYSLRQIKQIKGAAYVSAVMCACQKEPLDMLMYYDARPCSYGIFDTDVYCDKRKNYYSLYMFNQLYRLGNEVESHAEGDLYVGAATNGENRALVFTRFNDDDATAPEIVTLSMKGLTGKTVAEIYLLDKDHDLTLSQKLTLNGDSLDWEIEVPNFTSYMILLSDGTKSARAEANRETPEEYKQDLFIPNSVS